MNYIVFDLEWNQCPTGKEKEVKKLPFEIIEIGAVKLNSNLEVIDVFTETIKPRVYKNLHFKIREISKISMDELNESRDFKMVVNSFLDWCGEDVWFCTWGALDLTELQRNMQYFKIKRRLAFPLKYLDIQKLFSIDKEDGKVRRSLQYAVDFLDIEEGEQFHRALHDAEYTALVMKKIDFNRVNSFYSIDCYYVPGSKQDEIYARFLTYTKYISRKFSSKETALMDRDVIAVKCSECDRKLDFEIPWFSDNAKTYYALAKCQLHGYMKCKMKMKKNINGQVYVVKIVKPTSSEGIEMIEERQDIIREKRRERRLRHNVNSINQNEDVDEDD